MVRLQGELAGLEGRHARLERRRVALESLVGEAEFNLRTHRDELATAEREAAEERQRIQEEAIAQQAYDVTLVAWQEASAAAVEPAARVATLAEKFEAAADAVRAAEASRDTVALDSEATTEAGLVPQRAVVDASGWASAVRSQLEELAAELAAVEATSANRAAWLLACWDELAVYVVLRDDDESAPGPVRARLEAKRAEERARREREDAHRAAAAIVAAIGEKAARDLIHAKFERERMAVEAAGQLRQRDIESKREDEARRVAAEEARQAQLRAEAERDAAAAARSVWR